MSSLAHVTTERSLAVHLTIHNHRDYLSVRYTFRRFQHVIIAIGLESHHHFTMSAACSYQDGVQSEAQGPPH
jgi:hypothetical protein